MKWNITAECVSAIIVATLLFNSKKSSLSQTFRNIVFNSCLRITFLAIMVNIFSTVLLNYIQEVPIALNYALLIVYFISTPLMGVIYFLYTMTNIYEFNPRALLRNSLLACIPGIIYIIVVLLNPFTDFIFTLDRLTGYNRGQGIQYTYIIFYIYVILSLLVLTIYRKRLEKSLIRILAAFPILSCFVIVFQSIYPDIILTGFAAMYALLIVYMNLQNNQIFMDNLTGLLNRQEFRKIIDLRIKNQKPVYIFVLSLKEFKFINDKFGLHIGDILLTNISTFLKTIIVPQNNLYRYSGDEFAVISDSYETLMNNIMEIRERMKEPWIADTNELILKYTIGSISYPAVAKTQEEIVKGLESVTLEAKKEKGNIYRECSIAILKDIQRKYEIIEILKKTLAEDTFEVFFQPVYDVNGKVFNKAEALVRLPKNKLGFVSPAEFIPIAEETGMIIGLTYSVLCKTCTFIKKLLDAGIAIDGISVNFSIVQFMQEDLEETIMQIINAYQIPYKFIRIEITESILTADFDRVEHFIQNMKHLGIRFLLDDFGTGYSNFSRALSLPFDTIKLDRSLLHKAFEETQSAIFVTAIIPAFRKLSFKVLAEGIETEEELAYAVDNGCDYIQGYYYAKPMPEEEAFIFFHKHNLEETYESNSKSVLG